MNDTSLNTWLEQTEILIDFTEFSPLFKTLNEIADFILLAIGTFDESRYREAAVQMQC